MSIITALPEEEEYSYERAQVIRAHRPTDESQLELAVDDIVYILERDASGWWGGYKEGEDTTGWFPGNIVRVLQGASGARSGAEMVANAQVQEDAGNAAAQETTAQRAALPEPASDSRLSLAVAQPPVTDADSLPTARPDLSGACCDTGVVTARNNVAASLRAEILNVASPGRRASEQRRSSNPLSRGCDTVASARETPTGVASAAPAPTGSTLTPAATPVADPMRVAEVQTLRSELQEMKLKEKHTQRSHDAKLQELEAVVREERRRAAQLKRDLEAEQRRARESQEEVDALRREVQAKERYAEHRSEHRVERVPAATSEVSGAANGVAVANARRRLFEATVAASPPAASSSVQSGVSRGGTVCDLAQRLFPQASQLAPSRPQEVAGSAGVGDARPAVPPRPGMGAGASFRFGGNPCHGSPSSLANSRPAPSATVPTEETLPPRGRVRDHVANFEKRCATPNPARPERSDMPALGPRSASATPYARSTTPSRAFPAGTSVTSRNAPAGDSCQRSNLRRPEAAVVPQTSGGSLRPQNSARQGQSRPAELDLTRPTGEPGGDDEASEVVFGMSPVKRAASQALAPPQERTRPASATRLRDGGARSGVPGALPPPAASLTKGTSTSALVQPPQDPEEEIPSVRARVRQFDSGARRSRVD